MRIFFSIIFSISLLIACGTKERFEIPASQFFIVKKVNYEGELDVYYVKIETIPSVGDVGDFVWLNSAALAEHETISNALLHREQYSQAKGIRFDQVSLSYTAMSENSIGLSIPSKDSIGKSSPYICVSFFNTLEEANNYKNINCESARGIGVWLIE